MTGVEALLAGAAALLWVGFVGYSVVRTPSQGLSRPEIVAWSGAAGGLVHVLVYSFFLLLRIRPGTLSLVGVETALVVVALGLRRRKKLLRPPRLVRSWGLTGAIGACVIAFPIGIFTVRCLGEPFWTTDYLAIWGLKAKTIFFTAAIPERLFHDAFLWWSQPEYPLLLPLLFASVAALTGGWNEYGLALLYPACQLLTVLAVYGFLARRIGRFAGGVGGLFSAWFFPLYSPGILGTADIPLALGMVLAATAFLDADRLATGPSFRWRLLVGSFSCTALKQEGSLWIGLLAVTLLIRAESNRSRWRSALWLLIPWVCNKGLLLAVRGRIRDRDYDLTLLQPERWSDLGSRGLEVIVRVATVEAAAAALPLIAALGLIAITRRSECDRLLPPLAGQFLGYLAASSLSAYGPNWQIDTALGRLAGALFPSLTLILGCRSQQIWHSSVAWWRSRRIALG